MALVHHLCVVGTIVRVYPGWLERWMVAPKRAILCTANFSGPLGQQQARFGGQRAGSRPSFSALGYRCAVADVGAALRRFAPAGKARAGSTSSRASCRPAIAGHVALLLSRGCSVVATGSWWRRVQYWPEWSVSIALRGRIFIRFAASCR
jgi:hypothetical protein